jgi:hypothetical protein
VELGLSLQGNFKIALLGSSDFISHACLSVLGDFGQLHDYFA